MSEREQLVRELAHHLWKSRGAECGTPERDWYEAESMLGRFTHAQARTPARFYHCFTRATDLAVSLATLKLMLEVGVLLTPERLEFAAGPKVTQSRLSLAFIRPDELFRHSKKFGPFALEMAPYEILVGKFGTAPVWYVQSYFKQEAEKDIFPHGTDLVRGLEKLQTWIHSKQDDNTRHEPHRITRLAMRLVYPTQYKDSTLTEDIYYLQREWRIIRRDLGNEIVRLTTEEREKVVAHNPDFFTNKNKTMPVWSDDHGKMVDVQRIDATYKIAAPFPELVNRLLVPTAMIEHVEALNPGVPVESIERFEFGFGS